MKKKNPAFKAPCEAKPYESDKAFYEIRDADNEEIGGGWTKDEAAYIVKCVNSHEQLVEALQELLNLLNENEPLWYLKKHENIALKALKLAEGGI